MITDTELSVRNVAAQGLVPLSSLAVKYLEMGQALRAHGTFRVSGGSHLYDESQLEVSRTRSQSLSRVLTESSIRSLMISGWRSFNH